MIEVLKQALDALEKVKRRAVVMGSTGDYREGQLDALKAVSEDVKPAITSLRQAIAELEREKEIHDRHCNQGEWKGVCKYSDSNCPTIAELESQDDGYCQACDGALCTAKKGCVALSNPPQHTEQGVNHD